MDTEHFVTLFDHRFLPQGLALHDSLMRQDGDFHLWIVCLDQDVEEQLCRLSPRSTTLLSLAEIETKDLIKVKSLRSWREYCWTLTPFTYDLVFNRSDAHRVTYLDADVFFFGNPLNFLHELECTGKRILITDHAFAPSQSWRASIYGRFCVQFLTFDRDREASALRAEWSRQCVDSCSSEPGGNGSWFGDQQYLDEWPRRYPGLLHILSQVQDTLAPWNADHFMKMRGLRYFPVMYHFHSFGIAARWLVRLCESYRIARAMHLYDAYLESVKQQCTKLVSNGIPVPILPVFDERWAAIRMLKRFFCNRLYLRTMRIKAV